MPYALAMVAVVIGVDVLFLRHQFWPRLTANIASGREAYHQAALGRGTATSILPTPDTLSLPPGPPIANPGKCVTAVASADTDRLTFVYQVHLSEQLRAAYGSLQ